MAGAPAQEASAQTPVVDPNVAEFTASADHSRTDTSGQALVTRYDLQFFLVGAQQPFQTASLGKPTPDATNLVRVNLASVLAALPPPGVTYEARVAAVGPGGSGVSTVSNQFTFSNPTTCTFTASPTTVNNVAAGGATTTVTVTAPSGCAWTAASNASWLTITAGGSGSGNGTVTVSVAANSATTPRTGTLTIAGSTVTVTQAAAPCSYTVSPTSVSTAAAGGNATLTVTTTAGCAWTAVSNASWITVTAGASGSGGGTVTISVGANAALTSRSGTLTVAGRTVTVTQAGISCSYAVAPASVSSPYGGEARTITVTAPAGCSWSAVSNVPWITVNTGTSGSGNGAVTISIEPNSVTSPRSGTLTIAGQTVSVTQEAVPCSFAVTPASLATQTAGGTTSLIVSAPAGCAWTATSNVPWITVTAGATGSGDGTVAVTVAANGTTSARTGTLTVAGTTVTVTQDAAPCTYTIAPTTISTPAGGGSSTVSVTAPAGCAWTAASGASWLSITAGASGSGSGTVSVTVAPNTASSPRAATLTIGGSTVTVTQDAVPCSFAASPTTIASPAAGETATIAVTSAPGCAWIAGTGASWLAIVDGAAGSGDGTVRVAVAANFGSSPRTGTLTVAGTTITVTQAGAPCAYSVTPTSISSPSAGGSITLTVASGAGCAWTAASNAPWLTVANGSGGAGNGSVTVTVATNSDTNPRTGTLTVGGTTVTITQAGATACSFAVSPTTVTAPATGSSTSFTITAPAGCAWTATSSASWLTITSATTGTGGAVVTVLVSANGTSSPRTGALSIAGTEVTVTQPNGGCSYSVSPLSANVPATAGTLALTVTAPDGCSWAAQTLSAWMSVTSGSSGRGSGVVTVAIAASDRTTSRSGSLAIAGATVRVTQAPQTCSYAVAPTTANVPAAGGSLSVSVTSGTGCSWSALPGTDWLTVTAGSSGTGSGTATIAVAPNTATSPRTATVTVAGTPVTIVQEASAGCSYSVSPASTTAPPEGGTVSVSVAAPAGCAWDVASESSWVAIIGAPGGTGNGTLSLSVAPNDSGEIRAAMVNVAGQTVTLTQAPDTACAFTVTPASVSMPSDASDVNLTVTTAPGCAWTASSTTAWATITDGTSGFGSGTVTVSVAANGGAGRSATLAVAGTTVTVTQAAVASCSYTVMPASVSAPGTGTTANLTVAASAGCSWTATSPAAWVSITSGAAGTGNGMVAISVAPNATSASRNAALTIAGRTVNVTQAGLSCSYVLTPGSASVAAGGSSGAISVGTAAGCAWSASSPVSWVSITAGTGTGNGTVSYSVAPNTGPFARSTVLSVGGQPFTLTQASAGCSYTVTPTNGTMPGNGGTVTFTVDTAGGCSWIATNPSFWATVTSGRSGTGPGSVVVTAAANTSTLSRSTTMSIAGRVVTITQAPSAPTGPLVPPSNLRVIR